MRTIEQLITDAVVTCGSKKALAERIGIDPSEVSHLLNGTRQPTVEIVATLADVLTLSPTEAQRLACAAVAENPKNAGKAEMLRRVFGLPKATAKKATKLRNDITQQMHKLGKLLPLKHLRRKTRPRCATPGP